VKILSRYTLGEVIPATAGLTLMKTSNLVQKIFYILVICWNGIPHSSFTLILEFSFQGKNLVLLACVRKKTILIGWRLRINFDKMNFGLDWENFLQLQYIIIILISIHQKSIYSCTNVELFHIIFME